MSDLHRFAATAVAAFMLMATLPSIAQEMPTIEPEPEPTPAVESMDSTESSESTDVMESQESGPETASSSPGARYIGGMLIYRDVDSSRDFVDYGGGMNFIYGKQHNDRWNFEWVGSGAIHETDSSASDFYRYALGWDALWFLDREGISPYVVGGLGLVHNEILDEVGGDETGAFVNVGLGFLTQAIHETGAAIRGDLRLVHDSGVGATDLVAGVGLQMPLLRPQVAAAVVPAGPAGDADGDGVPDNLDKCPGTMAGLKVDETGCAVPQVFVLKGVSFDFDSTRLGVNAQTILEDSVRTMLGQPTMKVEIAGHTDNYGSEDYNRNLSQRRADAVKDYLASKTVSADNLRATGYGESQPVASNDSDFGREQNRRVEFRIESQ